MGMIVGGEFEDHGNAIEYSAGEVRAYEFLSGDRVRLYITEELGDGHLLQYKVIAPRCAFRAFSKICLEIADGTYLTPQWANRPLPEFAS